MLQDATDGRFGEAALQRTQLGEGQDRAVAEHPFGTIKAWMGPTYFLTRRPKNVRSEMALLVAAYNIRRMATLIGIRRLMRAIQA